jgi:endoglucanase
MRNRAVELLRELSEAHGPSGNEGPVRKIFRRLSGEETQTDLLGNIGCELRGTAEAPRIMLAAHMDEVGFAVQSVTSSGLLRFVPLGGWWSHTLLAQRVRIRNRRGEEVIGVIACKPPHMLSKSERDQLQQIDGMYIDIGARDADEVSSLFGIELGDPIVPDTPFSVLHSDWMLGKGFDDRAGLALGLQLCERMKKLPHPNTLINVGTVQEEVGTRGAQTICHSVQPDLAIILEGTPADDFPGGDVSTQQGVPGQGVQIRLMDPTAITNRALADFTIATARAHDIPHQVAVRRSGGTDAKVIHLRGAGIPTIVLGVPARYIHTHNGMIHLDDYMSTLELLTEMVCALDRQTVAGFTAFED